MDIESPDALLRRTAAFGLRTDRPPAGAGFDDETWQRFLGLVEAHRLSGLLDAAVRAGDVQLDPERRAEVEGLHRRVSARVLLLDTTLLRVATQLATQGIAVRVLKGPATASIYPDPRWRPYVDVDLLVPGDRFSDAASVLADLGYRRRSVELRPGFDRRFGKGATFHREADANIDLHRTLVAGPYGFLIDPTQLVDRPSEFEVAGTRLESLGSEARFIHSCISAVLSDPEPKLITIRDVMQGLDDPALDLDRMTQLCDRWRASTVVTSAVAVANAVLGFDAISLPDELVSRRASFVEQMARWAYRSDTRRWRRQALAAIPFVPGWADRAAYTRAVLGLRSAHAD